MTKQDEQATTLTLNLQNLNLLAQEILRLCKILLCNALDSNSVVMVLQKYLQSHGEKCLTVTILYKSVQWSEMLQFCQLPNND